MSEFLYGCDSSLTHFGYAVAEATYGGRPRFRVAGVLVTAPVKWKGLKKDAPTKTEDHQRRFSQLATDLRGVVERHGKPSLIAVESLALVRGMSVVAVSALGRARGLVDGLAAEHGLPVHNVFPQTIKRVLCGEVSAEKPAVIAAVRRLYPELHELFAQLHPDNVEHAADAVASLHVALTKEHHHAEANHEA